MASLHPDSLGSIWTFILAQFLHLQGWTLKSVYLQTCDWSACINPLLLLAEIRDYVTISERGMGKVKGEKFCFRYLDFYFRHGENTSIASQKSKDLHKVLLLLQDLVQFCWGKKCRVDFWFELILKIFISRDAEHWKLLVKLEIDWKMKRKIDRPNLAIKVFYWECVNIAKGIWNIIKYLFLHFHFFSSFQSFVLDSVYNDFSNEYYQSHNWSHTQNHKYCKM